MIKITLDKNHNEIRDLFLLHLKLWFHHGQNNPAFNVQIMFFLVTLTKNYHQEADQLLNQAKHNMLKYNYPNFNKLVEQTLRDIAQIITPNRKE